MKVLNTRKRSPGAGSMARNDLRPDVNNGASLRNNNTQSERIAPRSEPIYYGASNRPSSVRYSGILTNRPINSSIRNVSRPPTGNYIDAEIYPDL